MNAPDPFTRRRDAQDRERQLSAFRAVREASVALAAPLSAEDCQAQSMPDASPVKWHLAHTTWFFETFLLGAFAAHYEPAHPEYRMLFNSYYNAVGDKHPRPHRGLLTRPTLADVLAYRDRVDAAMAEVIDGRAACTGAREDFENLLTLGLNHEQQHQELILTDVKHLLSCNPMGPAYVAPPDSATPDAVAPDAATPDAVARGSAVPDARSPTTPAEAPSSAPLDFVRFDGGIVTIGHDGEGFGFDNEGPRHQVLLQPFALADRLVTCGEYAAFIEAGGYEQPEHWLSLGWDMVQAAGWRLPAYWRRSEGRHGQAGDRSAGGAAGFEEFTLHGWQPLNRAAPVSHLSFFEADAFARWSGCRLPTEAEWEHAAGRVPVPAEANLLERGLLRAMPAAAAPDAGLKQLWGDLWEWTASPYVPYPGFKASPGAVGEYNGKFMCNQYVLRGGSFATSRSHIRASYRNFFPVDARWQFTGLRLARDGSPTGDPSPRS